MLKYKNRVLEMHHEKAIIYWVNDAFKCLWAFKVKHQSFLVVIGIVAK